MREASYHPIQREKRLIAWENSLVCLCRVCSGMLSSKTRAWAELDKRNQLSFFSGTGCNSCGLVPCLILWNLPVYFLNIMYTLLYSFGEQLTLSVMRIIAISLSLHSGSIAFLLPHLFVIEKCLLIHKMNELWFGGKRSKSILKCLTIGKKYVKIFSEKDIVMVVEMCLKIAYQNFYRQTIKCMGSQKEFFLKWI